MLKYKDKLNRFCYVNGQFNGTKILKNFAVVFVFNRTMEGWSKINIKILSTVSAFVILISIPIIFLFSYEESEQFEGFPVPKAADLTANKSNLESYKWGPASEENGLPLRYQAIIRLWGWEKKEQEGALTVYEKDEKKVDLVSLTNYLSLSTSGKWTHNSSLPLNCPVIRIRKLIEEKLFYSLTIIPDCLKILYL